MASFGAILVLLTLCRLLMRNLPGCFRHRVLLLRHLPYGLYNFKILYDLVFHVISSKP